MHFLYYLFCFAGSELPDANYLNILGYRSIYQIQNDASATSFPRPRTTRLSIWILLFSGARAYNQALIGDSDFKLRSYDSDITISKTALEDCQRSIVRAMRQRLSRTSLLLNSRNWKYQATVTIWRPQNFQKISSISYATPSARTPRPITKINVFSLALSVFYFSLVKVKWRNALKPKYHLGVRCEEVNNNKPAVRSLSVKYQLETWSEAKLNRPNEKEFGNQISEYSYQPIDT